MMRYVRLERHAKGHLRRHQAGQRRSKRQPEEMGMGFAITRAGFASNSAWARHQSSKLIAAGIPGHCRRQHSSTRRYDWPDDSSLAAHLSFATVRRCLPNLPRAGYLPRTDTDSLRQLESERKRSTICHDLISQARKRRSRTLVRTGPYLNRKTPFPPQAATDDTSPTRSRGQRGEQSRLHRR